MTPMMMLDCSAAPMHGTVPRVMFCFGGLDGGANDFSYRQQQLHR